jgi:hypothetical protein
MGQKVPLIIKVIRIIFLDNKNEIESPVKSGAFL